MIRDRKMYVAPTPFGLVSGVAHTQTLILPEDFPITDDFQKVGALSRKEADRLIIGYAFDLKNNVLTPETVPNSFAGREHNFYAWRLGNESGEPVTMRTDLQITHESADDNDDE